MALEIALICLLLIVGLVLIIKGGDYFVDGASWLAEVSGIPKVIVGATIVSVATTLPEIVVSLISARAQPDMAIGNAVGSVVFNTGVILAIALVVNPFKIERKDYSFKGLLLVGVSAILMVFSFGNVDLKNITFQSNGIFGYVGAGLLLIAFVMFIIENVVSAKKHAQENLDNQTPKKDKKSVIINIIKLIGGAIGIGAGAILLKDNGVKLATISGMSQAVIGVTILAIGTSLPELVTMIIAVKKGQGSLSVGNIIGANTIDIAIILPLSAFIAGGKGLPVASEHLFLTLPITLLVISIAIIPSLIFKKFSRWQGVTIFTIYLAYFVYNIVSVVI
jgi:cation:H+ antiporter